MTYGSQIYHGSPKVLRGTQGDTLLQPTRSLNWLELLKEMLSHLALEQRLCLEPFLAEAPQSGLLLSPCSKKWLPSLSTQ